VESRKGKKGHESEEELLGQRRGIKEGVERVKVMGRQI
jgi:hypothetical protein